MIVVPYENIDIPIHTGKLFKFRRSEDMFHMLLRLEHGYRNVDTLEEWFVPVSVYMIPRVKDRYRLTDGKDFGYHIPILDEEKRPILWHNVKNFADMIYMDGKLSFYLAYFIRVYQLICTIDVKDTSILEGIWKPLEEWKPYYFKLSEQSRVFMDKQLMDTRYITSFKI